MLALVNGKLLTMTHGTIDGGTVLIDGGKIVAVGRDVTIPQGCKTVDCQGKYVLPGLIDANGMVGLHNDGFGSIGHDEDEKFTPVAPQLRAIDAIWPEDPALADCVKAGITAVSVGPATTGVITGQCAVIKTRGGAIDDMVVKAPAGLRISITGTPRSPWGNTGVTPRDRSTDIALLRQELRRAKEAIEKQEKAAAKADAGDAAGGPDRNLKQEVLIALLKGELPARVNVRYSYDIDNALELAREWGFKLILEDAPDAQLMVGDIAKAGAPVIVGPLPVNKEGERKNLSLKTPGILAKAGVKVAIASGFPETPIRYLFVSAALACSEGMPEDDALKAITINAAEILGVADRIGSLDAGKDADIVVYDGHPFEITSRVDRVYMDGELVAGGCCADAAHGCCKEGK
ncbi:MAG: amidohydrolase family protein [Chloroflexota bacterium]